MWQKQRASHDSNGRPMPRRVTKGTKRTKSTKKDTKNRLVSCSAFVAFVCFVTYAVGPCSATGQSLGQSG